MKKNPSIGPVNKPDYSYLLLILLVLFSSLSIAQIPANFSGKWAFDLPKSDPGKGGSFLYRDITFNITHNPSSLSIEQITKRSGKELFSTIETFGLDGKETIEKKDYGLTKKSAKWSEDQKNLILSTIITVDSKDYCDNSTYMLSDAGLTLTVEHKFRNPNEESTVVQVFHKKSEKN